MALPFLRAAARQYSVFIYCTPPVAGMLEAFVPGMHISPAADGWPARFWQGFTQLRKLRPAVALSAWSDSRTQLLGWLSGAKARIGFPMTPSNYYGAETPWRQRRLKIGCVVERIFAACGVTLLTSPLYRSSITESHFSNWHRLAESLNLTLATDPPWLDATTFPLPDTLRDFVTTHRKAGRPIWVLHPGGRLPTKRWPQERFQELLKGPLASHAVIIVEPPGESAPSPVGEYQVSIAASRHQELAATLRCADFVLCNDSYPAHLAAALGKKTFTIFGSGEPAWFAPYGNAERVIQKDVCPFHPCIDRCVMPSFVCLEAVSTAQVESRLQEATNSP